MNEVQKIKLRKMLIEHEGLRLRPYLCPAGKISIGVGRNLEDVGISEDEALYLLENDIRRAEQTARWCCRRHGIEFSGLQENVQLALLDMAFNLGYRLSGFRKMFAALKAGDYKEAAREMLDSKWATQVGSRAQELAEMVREALDDS